MARGIDPAVSIRSGTSFARGVALEQYISKEDADILHDRWKDDWPERLAFQGGIKSVTCEMLLQVPIGQLTRTYGKTRAHAWYELAEQWAALT